MLYIPKTDDNLKIVTNEQVKDFVGINFSEYFKSIRQEENIIKVAKSCCIFLRTPDELKKYVQWTSYNDCIHHYNVEILNIFWSRITSE